MDVRKRMMLTRLIEKMNTDEEYSHRLGLENISRLHGRVLNTEIIDYKDSVRVKNGRLDTC